MRVAISGASGLIGSALTAALKADDVQVTQLVRRAATSVDQISWDPLAGSAGLDPEALSNVDAVVHLSGAPVAPRRWTPARKALLRASRIESTKTLAAALLTADPRPRVMLCASAIGYYGDTGSRIVDETSPAGTGFLAGLVRDWEAATDPVKAAGIRVANIRSGLVLGAAGGLLGPLTLPFRLGLGAKIGSGRQYMSWIALADEVRAIRFLLDDDRLDGPFNLTAPAPVTNAEFTTAFATALGRRAVLAIPSAVLRAALGEVSGELLGSARVLPSRLSEAGFTFSHPQIDAALAALFGTDAQAAGR